MKYVAYDGKEFDTAAECLQYEANVLNTKPQMWDVNGALTEDVESAWLVHLANLNETTWLLNKTTLSEGIDEESTGWFYWDDWDERYIWLDEKLVNIIHKSALISKEDDNSLKTYRVTLTKVQDYRVSAFNKEDAESKGMDMYFNDNNAFDTSIPSLSVTEITD